MRNAGLEEAQVGIKLSGRNIKNLRYADDTILMADSEEELKAFVQEIKQSNTLEIVQFISVVQLCWTLCGDC